MLTNGEMPPIESDLLEILRCPKCLGTLSEREGGLACAKCKLVYPVVGEIAHFLVEEARPLEG